MCVRFWEVLFGSFKGQTKRKPFFLRFSSLERSPFPPKTADSKAMVKPPKRGNRTIPPGSIARQAARRA